MSKDQVENINVIDEDAYAEEQYNDLILSCSKHVKVKDIKLIRKAFDLAKESHKGIKRKSGEPYITHPIAVAKIVTSEIGLGATSIACALLHDVVEDTEYTIEDIDHFFGEKIAAIIDGLTKISGVFDKQSSLQAENFRKMLLTLSDDVRVILIKIADRLHNMRTLDSMPANKQLKIAGETIYLYAPLAHRLGLYAIKTELEDLSLKYRHLNVFEEITTKIQINEKKRQQEINRFSLPIIEKLEENNIEFDINGRPKSIFSIWNKMQNKNIPFEEVYDLMAIRIIFKALNRETEKAQCWQIYSLITDTYTPKPDRIRDWISSPKANGYEALHTTVMGPTGKWVEVQIRSERMDTIAERGFAAHWKYKGDKASESELDKWIKKIREMLENPNSDALEFLDEFKMNLFSSEIMVFTPKGDLKTLPKYSTTLDFAYEIHSEIGNKAIGAKVNHKLVALNHILRSGDQVEIITSNKQKIQNEWLHQVRTAKAKSSITDAIKAETKDRIKKGKKLLETKLKELKVPPSSRVFRKIIPEYDVSTKDELYSKIGSGIILLENLKKILKKNTKNKLIRYWGLQISKSSSSGKSKKETNTSAKNKKFNYKNPLIIKEITESDNNNILIAKCCSPIPGDDVIGYKKPKDNNITIHKSKCPTAIRLMSSEGNYIVPAKWTSQKFLSSLAKLSLNGIDRIGIAADITTVISNELSVNIRKIFIETHDGIFEGEIELYVHNVNDLNNLIMNISKLKGVDSVKRKEEIVK
ncbi:MAG: bifunctional (p)ppGpp synthetase/guanosine-3',5'-bis(diphosphate) 3'-pyrophosphohydrolase [Bacteroidales bacterium]|nr:bifunctional (p)ppGpp synthetase/guanosine-3',5'-bis(diphosphate) 3'-pyrophosphohydrolase [Bacteroidales bacterium]